MADSDRKEEKDDLDTPWSKSGKDLPGGESDDRPAPRSKGPKSRAGAKLGPAKPAAKVEESDDEDDEDDEEEAERERLRRKKKAAKRKAAAAAAAAREEAGDDDDEPAGPEQPAEDPYWWTPHAVMVGLILIGFISFMLAYQKRPKPDAPEEKHGAITAPAATGGESRRG
jgi:hypothetical protein